MNFVPLCIYPEGTTTGGSNLLSFKRGAFQAMRTVQPCFLKLDWGVVNPAIDSIGILDVLVLTLSNFVPTLSTLYFMPPFVPNQFMLDKHDDKGEYDWQIYAWCVRDAMAKAGGFELCEQSIKDLLTFEKF